MDFAYKGPLSDAPAELMPWFEHPQRRAGIPRIVFGHWSALGLLQRDLLLGLDTGCVWGGSLTALRIDIPDAQAVKLPSLQPKKL
jgi:bis(5'-nucleosyl)-tetraphosphatase (symmetrical)